MIGFFLLKGIAAFRVQKAFVGYLLSPGDQCSHKSSLMAVFSLCSMLKQG
jgi:hypothetical protein